MPGPNSSNIRTCQTSPRLWPQPGSFSAVSNAFCIAPAPVFHTSLNDTPLITALSSALAQRPFHQPPSPMHSLTPSSFSEFLLRQSFEYDEAHHVFAYKKVANKVEPVATTVPAHACIIHRIPEDLLLPLPALSPLPPDFTPGTRLTQERMDELGIFQNDFLWLEEQKLPAHVLTNNELALAWDESENDHFKDKYFPPVIIPTIEHTPWAHRQPIPPGVYEPSTSSYQYRWFRMAKKSGTVRIVYDLQQLNSIAVKDFVAMPHGRHLVLYQQLVPPRRSRRRGVPAQVFRLLACPIPSPQSLSHRSVLLPPHGTSTHICSPTSAILIGTPSTPYLF